MHERQGRYREENANQVETTQVGGVLYEIEKLREYAEIIPTKNVPLEDVMEAVGKGHIYWIDRNGEQLAPYQIIQDWESAQQNEAWADHVASIKRADKEAPIWMTKDGHVFDGIHRLTRAVIDGDPTIRVKIFEKMPAIE